jgi:hypothetical protein
MPIVTLRKPANPCANLAQLHAYGSELSASKARGSLVRFAPATLDSPSARFDQTVLNLFSRATNGLVPTDLLSTLGPDSLMLSGSGLVFARSGDINNDPFARYFDAHASFGFRVVQYGETWDGNLTDFTHEVDFDAPSSAGGLFQEFSLFVHRWGDTTTLDITADLASDAASEAWTRDFAPELAQALKQYAADDGTYVVRARQYQDGGLDFGSMGADQSQQYINVYSAAFERASSQAQRDGIDPSVPSKAFPWLPFVDVVSQ